jgi:hypothetical protein
MGTAQCSSGDLGTSGQLPRSGIGPQSVAKPESQIFLNATILDRELLQTFRASSHMTNSPDTIKLLLQRTPAVAAVNFANLVTKSKPKSGRR